MDLKSLNHPADESALSQYSSKQGMETFDLIKWIKARFSSKLGKSTPMFVLLTNYTLKFRGLLYEIQVDQRGRVKGGSVAARFFDESYNLPPFVTMGGVCISNKLYLLISRVDDHEHDVYDEVTYHRICKCEVLNGFVFDLKTRALVKFKPPKENKAVGVVIYAYEKIYFLLDPCCNPKEPKDSFERYDPITDSWKSLEPFPYSREWLGTQITGHAVCQGSILLSVFKQQRYSLMAYHIHRNCWEPVHVDDSAQLLWTGCAVVLDKTVYASSLHVGDVITFSIRTDTTDEGHGSITLSKPTKLSGLDIKDGPPTHSDWQTQYLTHLGDLHFCLVQSCYNYRDRQALYITTFLVEEGNNVKVLNSVTRDVEGLNLSVAFCFPGDMGQIGDNTTVMNQHQDVGGTHRSSNGLTVPSKTQSCTVWSSWAMNKAKVVTYYGFIPFVIIMGIKYSKPALSRLLKHD